MDEILVPSTARSSLESDKALELAEQTGASIRAVYVIEKPPIHDPEFWDRLVRHYTESGKKELEELEEKASRKGIEFESEVCRGEPSKEIVKCAEKHGSDMILMARNCQGQYQDLLLGSTAKNVIENAETPVMTFAEVEES